MTLDDVSDLGFFVHRGEHDACSHTGKNSVFALSAAKDENNGWQHLVVFQHVHYLWS